MGCKFCVQGDSKEIDTGLLPIIKTNNGSINSPTKNNVAKDTYHPSTNNIMLPNTHSSSDNQIQNSFNNSKSNVLPTSSNNITQEPILTTSSQKLDAVEKPEENIKQLDIKINTSLFRKENTHSIYDNYDMLEILGKGSFGEVKKCRLKANGEIRAVKIIDKLFCVECDSMVSEIKALKELDHPNILKLFEFYQDAQFYYLVTEFCAGKELFDKIVALKYFSEMRAAKILQQVLSAVVYCHSHNICHRDLKPENLLLEEDSIDSNIKVIDFGTSKFCKLNERMKEKYGTPYYIAPEVIKKDYNMKCDIWSCGVILYIMLSGHPPFGGRNNEEIMNRVLEGKYDYERKEWCHVSELAKDLINKMLTYDPNSRIGAEETMNHQWLKKYTKLSENSEDIKISLDALNRFTLGQNLQIATLAFFAVQMQNKSEESKLRKKFKIIDKNNDGILSKQELINGFTDIYKDEKKAIIEVNEVMGKLDVNKDGSINYTEFLMAHMQMKDFISNDRLKAAFQSFDLDNNGQITKDELQAVLAGTSVNDTKIWDDLINEADTNHDSQICFEEFKQMMLNYANKRILIAKPSTDEKPIE